MNGQTIHLESKSTVERAGKWLECFLRTRLFELNQQELCVGLIGLSCASRALGSCPATTDFSATVGSLIGALLGKWTSYQDESRHGFIDDPVTRLLSAVFAAPDNTETAAYRHAVQEQWHALEEQVTLASAHHRVLTCRLLAALLDESPELPDLSLLSGFVPMSSFSHYLADAASIQETLEVLTTLTAHGRLLPELTQPEVDFVQKTLPFWTFYYIKERDLDSVCPLARTLKYLHLEALSEYGEAIRYILRQAREDGSFCTQDMSCKCQSYLLPESIDVDREMRLPLTVASIWTLLECLHSSESPFHHPFGVLIDD
jgi:hypothetical protein